MVTIGSINFLLLLQEECVSNFIVWSHQTGCALLRVLAYLYVHIDQDKNCCAHIPLRTNGYKKLERLALAFLDALGLLQNMFAYVDEPLMPPCNVFVSAQRFAPPNFLLSRNFVISTSMSTSVCIFLINTSQIIGLRTS